jgi:hypothetical protein
MLRTQQPDRVEREKVNGEDVTVEIYYSDVDYHARIEIERVDSWEFGVDEVASAELLTTTSTDEPEIPAWLADSLRGLGIEELEGITGVA